MLARFYAWLTSWKVVRVLLLILLIVFLIAITVGLWFVNRYYRVEDDLLSPVRGLHPYWLPLLFLLVIAGAGLGYWFFKLLTDPPSGEFPDIDDAWAEGVAALDRAGIDAREVPLFLVVGTPRTGTADFFAATKLPLAVRAEPRRLDAPLKVYATREAVYVTCEGASALARFAVQLATHGQPVAVPTSPDTDPGSAHLLDSAEVATGEPTAVTTATTGAADPSAHVWLPAPDAGGSADLPTDVRECSALRLAYLCRLIAERRRPFCAANGIIWLIPEAATATEHRADACAAACRADLAAADDGLQVYCPSAAVVCDAQNLTGFRDLLRGLPESLARERLLGRSFPLVPGVPADERPGVIFGGIDWVARHLAPGVAYQRFGSEAEGNGERWSAANARLWTLTADLYDRRAALARLVSQGLTDGTSRPPMLAGVYLAGTGPDELDQAFAAGVTAQLVALQNSVSWTEAAEAEEADYRRMTVIGYAAALVLVIAVAIFGYTTWR